MPTSPDRAAVLTPDGIERFLCAQQAQGRSAASLKRYAADLNALCQFVPAGTALTRRILTLWLQDMQRRGYTHSTIRARLTTVNRYTAQCGRPDLCVRWQVPAESDKAALTRQEYETLLATAQASGNRVAWLLLRLLGTCGLPLSAVQQVTVEAAAANRLRLPDGEERQLPPDICRCLLDYAAGTRRRKGPVFRSQAGNPLSRTTVLQILYAVARDACIAPDKITARNLRSLYRPAPAEPTAQPGPQAP